MKSQIETKTPQPQAPHSVRMTSTLSGGMHDPYPFTDAQRASYLWKFGRMSTSRLRHLAQVDPGWPDGRRPWFAKVADRLDNAGYSTVGDVPYEEFPIIASEWL